jgi:hypothetical protein
MTGSTEVQFRVSSRVACRMTICGKRCNALLGRLDKVQSTTEYNGCCHTQQNSTREIQGLFLGFVQLTCKHSVLIVKHVMLYNSMMNDAMIVLAHSTVDSSVLASEHFGSQITPRRTIVSILAKTASSVHGFYIKS